jgi:hypothetical protein
MKNFENFKTQELTYSEMHETEGGILLLLAAWYLGRHWDEVCEGYRASTSF